MSVDRRTNGHEASLFRQDSVFDLGKLQEAQHRNGEISFVDYLSGLERGEIPVPNRASEILYAAVTTPAPIELASGVRQFPFFFEHPEHAVFGMHGSIEQYVDAIRAGSQKKAVLLVSGTGAGKSKMVEASKAGFESEVRRRNQSGNPIYVVDGCPVQEKAANLLSLGYPEPEDRRRLHEEHGIEIHPLCPECQARFGTVRMGTGDDGQPKIISGQDIRTAKVVPMEVSIAQRKGIATLTPNDTVGSDTQAIDRMSEIILASNNGILELNELGMHDPKVLRLFNDLLRGRVWQRNGQRYHLDNFIVAHTTREELRRMQSDNALESLFRRFDIIDMPYNLDSTAERRIYGKGMAEDNTAFAVTEPEPTTGIPHVSDGAFKLFAEFGVLTRFHEEGEAEAQGEGTSSTEGEMNLQDLTLTEKLNLYEGRAIRGLSKEQSRKVIKTQNKARRDGYTGISPAEVQALMQSAVERAADREGCLDPITALQVIADYVVDLDYTDQEVDFEVVETLGERLDGWVVDQIRKGFVPDFADKREALFDAYISESQLAISNGTRIDAFTRQPVGADTEWLEEVENRGSSYNPRGTKDRNRSRQDVLQLTHRAIGQGGQSVNDVERPHFADAPDWLRFGIDDMIFNHALMETVVANQGMGDPNAKHVREFEELSAHMEHNGLCSHCVPIILNYARTQDLLTKHKAK